MYLPRQQAELSSYQYSTTYFTTKSNKSETIKLTVDERAHLKTIGAIFRW